MSSHSSRGKIMFGATLAGFGGVLSGWALFLLVVEESGHLRQLLGALLIAALVALALEYFRETIREGRSEIEEFSFIPAGIGIVTLVIVCELFVKANEHVAEVFGSLPAVHAALIGIDPAASQLNPWWTLAGLLGIWVYMGVAASRWLIGMIGGNRINSTAQFSARVGMGAALGAAAALLCALFSIFGLLAFRLFVILADQAEFRAAMSQIGDLQRLPPWVVPFAWFMKLWHYLLSVLGDWKLNAWWGTSWRAIPAAFVVLCLSSVPFYVSAIAREDGWKSVRPKGWAWLWLGLFVWILVAPLVLQQPWLLAMFPLKAISIWLIPCLILGSAIPLLESAAERAGWWLGIALAVSAILLVAVSIWQREFGGIVFGAIFLGLSLIGFSLQGRSRTFQSLLPVFMAVVMLGPHGLWVQATRAFLGDWQTLATTQPAAAKFIQIRWFYPEPLSAYIGQAKARDAIIADLADMERELNRSLNGLRHLSETEWVLAEFFGRNATDPNAAKSNNSASPHRRETPGEPSEMHAGDDSAQPVHDLPGNRVGDPGERHDSDHKPIFDLVNEFVWIVDNLSVEFQPILEEIGTYLARVKADYPPPIPKSDSKFEPLSKPFLQGLYPEISAAAGRVSALADTLREAVEFRKPNLTAQLPRLRELAGNASLKLSQWLEQCVSAAFGFWVTLALLATWRRLQR